MGRTNPTWRGSLAPRWEALAAVVRDKKAELEVLTCLAQETIHEPVSQRGACLPLAETATFPLVRDDKSSKQWWACRMTRWKVVYKITWPNGKMRYRQESWMSS